MIARDEEYPAASTLQSLTRQIVGCRKCPRLVEWREKIALEKTRRFREERYWGKPVPGFGDPRARLLVVGLAPAGHGGNRTGRMFTGDRSGEWLYRALHAFGFASSPESRSRGDGLKLLDCYITAAARCAPPQNKLAGPELQNCRPYLLTEMKLLHRTRVIVALGKTAFDATVDASRSLNLTSVRQRPAFGHGAEHVIGKHLTLLASYHPSQQNTFTGKLTGVMFDAIFRRARELLQSY